MRRILWLVLLFATALAPARDKAENWIEVRSPHFDVVTNSNEKQDAGLPISSSACGRYFILRFLICKPIPGCRSLCWPSGTKKTSKHLNRRPIWPKDNSNWADSFFGQRTRTTFL